MSSSLDLITCNEDVPADLSPTQLLLWGADHVSKDEFGSFFIDRQSDNAPTVYINNHIHYYANPEWTKAVDCLLKSSNEKSVVISKNLMVKLWNDKTLAIYHSSKGYLTKDDWIRFVNETTFIIYSDR